MCFGMRGMRRLLLRCCSTSEQSVEHGHASREHLTLARCVLRSKARNEMHGSTSVIIGEYRRAGAENETEPGQRDDEQLLLLLSETAAVVMRVLDSAVHSDPSRWTHTTVGLWSCSSRVRQQHNP